MSNVDWFKRKLSEARGDEPAQTSYPPTSWSPAPQPVPMSPNVAPPTQQTPMVSPSGVDMNQQFTMEGVGDAVRNWQGDTKKGATALERSRCPNCGGDKFFSRTNSGGTITQQGKVPPAPHCFECGHNGLFEQYGAQVE